MAKKLTFTQLIRQEIDKELKAVKRQKFQLKIKVLFTVLLPIVILLLGLKVMQTFVKLKLKSILPTPTPHRLPSAPKPAAQQAFKPEMITPEPIPPIPTDTITITELSEDA